MNYNKGAGQGYTDKDFIEELGLDPALEGTPQINNAIRKELINRTTRHYVQQGLTEDRAYNLARKSIK